MDELEVSNVELEAKLASYGSGGKFSDHELTSGGEEGYPGSPRRSLCTPPPSPNRRGSSGSSPASPAQVSSLSFFLFFSYLSFYFKQKERGALSFFQYPQKLFCFSWHLTIISRILNVAFCIPI